MRARRDQVRRRVDAPAATARVLLSDADSYRDWSPSGVSIEGPIVLGGTVRLVSEVDPGRTYRLRVAELEAPHRTVWSSGMPTRWRTRPTGAASSPWWRSSPAP